MTPAQGFDHAFQRVLEDVLGWDADIGLDDHRGLVGGWGSLAQIRIVHELETRFDIRLPDEALLEEQSVGSLKQLVLDCVGQT